MKKSRLGSRNSNLNEPKVGIWWDDGRTLAAIPHSPNENSHLGQFIDSNLNHVDEWPKIARQFGKSEHSEYFETPRGRVLLDPKKNLGIIYHGSATSKSRLVEIAKAFELDDWKASIDEHYEIGDAADEVFWDA